MTQASHTVHARRLVIVLMRLLWLPWLLAACLCGPAHAADAPPITLNTALVAVGEGFAFPIGAATRAVSLPDDWASRRPGVRGPVWYRMAFDAPAVAASDALSALYIAQVCTNLEVYLNARLIHSGGSMVEPYTHNCNQPQLVALPASLVRGGRNIVDIKVAGHRVAEVGSRFRAGHLSSIELGSYADMSTLHAAQTTLQVALPQAISATLVLLGSFMFVMGFNQRRESHLAYFGALCVGFAIIDARLWLHDLPLPSSVAEFLLTAMLPFITLAAVQFLLRHAKMRIAWVNRAMPAQCALMPLSLVLAGPSRLYLMAMIWYLLLALQVVIAALFYLRWQWPRRKPSFWLMALMLAAAAMVGVIEFAAQVHGERPVVAQLAEGVLPLMFVLVGLRLMQLHGRALIEAEQGKAHLEQRIREATAEIERNFNQLSELRVEQVTERERKRIAADLHDDLGAKLLTIVHTSDSERISTLAREALEEMRLSVRGLTGRAVQLSDALGDWRAEVVSRLGQAGIEADWTAPEDLPQRLSARAYVQTTRILREVTSNIIKHSGASRCTVRCSVADGDFSLVVQDNGNGISADIEARIDRGHGLASMKHRAKQLQGQCLVESGPGYGTVIRLTLPMDRAVEAP